MLDGWNLRWLGDPFRRLPSPALVLDAVLLDDLVVRPSCPSDSWLIYTVREGSPVVLAHVVYD